MKNISKNFKRRFEEYAFRWTHERPVHDDHDDQVNISKQEDMEVWVKWGDIDLHIHFSENDKLNKPTTLLSEEFYFQYFRN